MTARISRFCLLAALVGAAPLARAQMHRLAFDQEPYTHAQRLVQIGSGRRLNLYCTGHGTPVVIFDYGLGGPSTAWANVQPEIAKITQACSYDRAGEGFSDAGPLPRDTNAMVSDLHTLLHEAGLPPPYIFVGHSLAGLDGVLFADRYLSELAGMVLVDPSFAHQNEAFAKIPGFAALMAHAPRMSLAPCEAAARAHELPKDPKLVDLCLDHDPQYGAALMAANDALALRPEFWQALTSEGESFNAQLHSTDIDSPELDAAARDYGTLKLIVLTAGDQPHFPGMTPAMAARKFAAWKAGHDVIAAKSRNGRNQIVPDATHYIQFDRPQVVVNAIDEVIEAARKDK